MSQVQPAELKVEQFIFNSFGKTFDPVEVQQQLLTIADLVEAKPQFAWGPELNFVWLLPQDRMLTVEVAPDLGRDRFHLLAHSTEAQAVEDSLALAHEHQQNVDWAAQLWRLPIAEQPWNEAGFVMTSWESCFSVLERLSTLPTMLELIPNQWRKRWSDSAPGMMALNLAGTAVASVGIFFHPGSLHLDITPDPNGPGLPQLPADPSSPPYEDDRIVEIPHHSLGRRGVDLPAFIAGLTATGSYREVCGIQMFDAFTYLPQAPQCGKHEFEIVDDPPERTQSLEELLAALKAEPQIRAPRPGALAAPFTPNSDAEQAVALLLQVVTAGAQPIELLTDHGATWEQVGDRATGTLWGTPVSVQTWPGHPSSMQLTIAAPPLRHQFDAAGLSSYTGKVNALLTSALGEPSSFTATTLSGSIRRWKANGETCVYLNASASGQGVELGLEPWTNVAEMFSW